MINFCLQTERYKNFQMLRFFVKKNIKFLHQNISYKHSRGGDFFLSSIVIFDDSLRNESSAKSTRVLSSSNVFLRKSYKISKTSRFGKSSFLRATRNNKVGLFCKQNFNLRFNRIVCKNVCTKQLKFCYLNNY